MGDTAFGGIFIPREILLDVHTTSTCKLLYGYLHALDGERGCFAGNDYLAKCLDTSIETVRASMYILEKRGYIERTKDEQGNRIIRTAQTKILAKIASKPWNPPTGKSVHPTEKSVVTPTEKSVAYKDKDTTDSNDINTVPVVEDSVEIKNYSKEFVAVWKEFKSFRRKMKRPITEYGEKLMFKRFVGVDEKKLIKAIQLSIERSWIGIFPDAVDYSNSKTNRNEPLTDNDHVTF